MCSNCFHYVGLSGSVDIWETIANMPLSLIFGEMPPFKIFQNSVIYQITWIYKTNCLTVTRLIAMSWNDIIIVCELHEVLGLFDWALSLHNSQQLLNFPIGLTAPAEWKKRELRSENAQWNGPKVFVLGFRTNNYEDPSFSVTKKYQ